MRLPIPPPRQGRRNSSKAIPQCQRKRQEKQRSGAVIAQSGRRRRARHEARRPYLIRQRDEGEEAAGRVLLGAEPQQVIDPLGGGLDVAVEHGRDGVRVNAVSPGWIASSGMDTYQGEFKERIPKLKNFCPLGRLGTAAEVADMCVYLLSDESRFVTGAEFVIDGGLTAR